jgi:FAD:protein FMN transferase
MFKVTRLASLFILLGLTACNRNAPLPESPITLEGYAFGSTYTLKYFGTAEATALKKKVEQFLQEFDQEFSTYRPDSIITRFNQIQPGLHLKVSSRFIAMLKLAKALHIETGGAFDPSLGKSIQLWGFGGSERKTIPTRHELAIAKSNSKMDMIAWDEANHEVWKTQTVVLDVNAFAPGWAADLLGQQLKQQGLNDFMVDISGEILFQGKRPDGSDWIGGIETPNEKNAGKVHLAFRISNQALATSGNYRQFRMQNGKKKSHILSPETHQPIENNIASASVIADSAARADAWSTAMMVKGEKGIEDAKKAGVKAYLILLHEDGSLKPLMNPSMKEFLQSNQI